MDQTSNWLTPLLNAGINLGTSSIAQNQALKSQQANQALLAPIANEQFTPGDLTQTPGYQFQLQQGLNALNNQNSAAGNYFSGSALKGTQDYAQGLAGTTYNNAYNQFLQTQQQKLGALQGQAQTNNNIGGIQAGTTNKYGNILGGSLGSYIGSNPSWLQGLFG